MIYKAFFRKKKSGKVRELLQQGTISYTMIIIPLIVPFCLVEALLLLAL